MDAILTIVPGNNDTNADRCAQHIVADMYWHADRLDNFLANGCGIFRKVDFRQQNNELVSPVS